MAFLDSIRSLFSSGKVNVQQRFELLREAISGTMSAFYVARDRRSGEIVGLKLLDMEKLNMVEARFKSLNKPPEGEIGKSFDHPSIVKTLDFGVSTTGQQFVVMEFLDGPGLNSVLVAKDPALNGKRVSLLRQAAEALAYVHRAGYIHRDICPRNYVVAKDFQTLKLIDFGLTLPAKPEFMQPGNRTGTPNYMAPEVVRRKKTDQRVDIFSWGVLAYEVCTFDLPWSRGKTGMVAMEHDREPTDIFARVPNLNPQLGQIIMRCLAATPDKRPQSMDEVINVLKQIRSETA